MELLATGGPVMWIIAAMSVFALAIALAKLWEFTRTGVWRRRAAMQALAAWRAGRGREALERLEHVRDPLGDVLRTALQGRLDPQIDEALVREEVARRGSAWLESLRGALRPLELIGTLAPLLGLLGTVLGMIEAFRALESAGSRVDPSILSGGIWVALLTTAAGLSVAIPAVAVHMFFERQLERLHHHMQDAATRIFSERVPVSTAMNEDVPSMTEDRQPVPDAMPGRLAEAAGVD